MYAGSNNLDEIAWYHDNSNAKTHPVAQLKPNAWGLYDCCGNVYEWCNDARYGSAYKNRIGTVVDPCVYKNRPVSRSIRGGYWDDTTDGCRVAYRSNLVPDFCGIGLGFRLARKSDG